MNAFEKYAREVAELVPGVVPVVGEHGTFRVKSRSGNALHLVDLFAYGFNGQCSCEDFKFRREAALARGAKSNPNWRCFHIKRARQMFTEFELRSVFDMVQAQKVVRRFPTLTR